MVKNMFRKWHGLKGSIYQDPQTKKICHDHTNKNHDASAIVGMGHGNFVGNVLYMIHRLKNAYTIISWHDPYTENVD